MNTVRIPAPGTEGSRIVIPVSAEDIAAVGQLDATRLADWMWTAYIELGAARRGDPRTAENYAATMADLTRLIPRLEAILNHAIRGHADNRGSVAEAAAVLEIPEGSVSTRRTRARDLNRPFTAWVTTSIPAEAEPGSPQWLAVQSGRLRRAVADQDWEVIMQVSGEAAEAGYTTDDLLHSGPDAHERDSNLMHDAIEWMIWRQDTPLTAEQRARYLTITNRVERAHTVIRLYGGLIIGWGAGDPSGVLTTVEAQQVATRILENEAHRDLDAIIDATSEALNDETSDRQAVLETLLDQLSELNKRQ